MKPTRNQIQSAATKLLVCTGLLAASAALAVDRTWTNSVSDNLLATAINWSPNGTPSSASDNLIWDGTAPGNLVLTNAGALDTNPGFNINVTSGQTGALTIVEGIGNSGRIRLNTKLQVDSGAGAVTFGSVDTPALPLALAGIGNGAVHGWTNNSANPVTINTNVYYVMGGGGSHTLSLAGSGNFILKNSIQAQNSGGNLNLSVNGSGTVTLVGTPSPGISFAGTYSTTVLNTGTLKLADAGALGISTLNITGGNLDSAVANLVNINNNVQNWNGNFGFVGTENLNLGFGAVTMNASRIVTVSAKTLQVDGAIAGTGFSLTKAGAGTLVLGGANTYSGGTVVSNGVLKMANSSALGASGANLTVHGTLDLNGNSLVVGTLSGNATGIIDDVAGFGSDTLTVSDTTSGTFAGVIKNTSGTLSLTKNGSGTLTLGGANTYSGNTTVNAGTLLVNGSIGAGAVSVASGAGFGGSGTVGGTVSWQSGSSASFMLTPTTGVGSNSTPLTVSGSVTLNGNSLTVNVAGGTPLPPGTYRLMTYNNSGSSGAFATGTPVYTGAGVQAGTASTVATSGGAVTLTVALTGVSAVWTNSTSGNWNTAANWSSNPLTPHAAGDGAILGVGADYTTITLDTAATVGLIQFTNANSFLIANAGNTLTIDNTGVGAAISVLAGTSNAIAPAVALNDNLAIAPASGTAVTINNTIANASGAKTVTVNGAGTVAFASNNTYGPASSGTVGTILGGGGVLQVNTAGGLGAGDLNVTNSATLRAGVPMTLANNIIAGSGTATVDDNGNNVTLAGVISGGGAFAKTGAGTVSVSGANSFAGAASINAGTLKLLNVGGLSTNGINLGLGATLDLNGLSPVFGALNSAFSNATIDSLSGGSVTLTVGQTNAFGTFAGSIKNTSGTLTLVKEGTGTQTLTGTNTYTGGTTINAGTLQVGNGGTTGTLGSGPLLNNGNLAFNLAGDNIFAQQITGTGAVNLASSAMTLRLHGNNTFTGPINITFGGGGHLWFTNASALGIGPKTVLCNSGGNSLHLNGIAGNIDVDSSISFQISNGSGVLYNEAGSNTISGSIGMVNGNGDSLVVVNSGFLTLAGQVGTVSGNNARTLILSGAGNGLVSGSIITDGNACSVTKQGAGTWTLTGANSYTGPTTVNGGTLVINGDHVGNGNITVTNGGTLLINGNNYGSGTFTVYSNSTLGGAGFIYSATTLQPGAKGSFTTSASGATPLTIYGNVTLNNNPLEVFVAGGTPLPAGQYQLLVEGNTSLYAISGSAATTAIITGAGLQTGTQAIITSSATEVKLVVYNSSAWTLNGNGNWTTGANWSSNPNFPSSAGEFAVLGVGSSLITVTLNASQTIGGLNFTNANSFVIANAANTLTLNNNGIGSLISVAAGTANAVASKVSLEDTTSITTATNTALAISGNVDGFAGLNLSGNGAVTLSGVNSFSAGVALSGGTLILGSTTAVGSGPLTLAGGNLDSSVPNLVNANNNSQSWSGSFTFLGSQNLNLGNGFVDVGSAEKTVTVNTNMLTVAGSVSGSGRISKAGAGTLVLLGNNSSHSGGVRIMAGPVVIGDDAALGTGTVEFQNDATIQSSDSTARTLANAMNLSAGGIYAGTGNLTFTGPLASGSFGKAIVVSNAVTTFSGVLDGGTSQNAANTKTGPGTLILSGDNFALAKKMAVSEGTLALGSATALGSGEFTLNGGGLDSLVVDLVNAGNNPQVWNGSFYFNGTENLNLGTGAVTLNADTTVTVSNKTLTVGGGVSGVTRNLTKAGAGTLVLSGANAYGNTTVNGGTLAIAQATLTTNKIVSVASGAVLQLNFSTTNQIGGLKLNGVSQPNGVYQSTTPGGYLAGTGSLLVVNVGPSGPAYLTNSLSGSTLSLSWPPGQGWRLQAQTNSLNVGLSGNWAYVTDGSVSSTNIAVNANNPTVFYRLTYP